MGVGPIGDSRREISNAILRKDLGDISVLVGHSVILFVDAVAVTLFCSADSIPVLVSMSAMTVTMIVEEEETKYIRGQTARAHD